MRETLRRYWGYDSFRSKQEDIITEALSGRDILAILPTGGGKSICFQVPAMMSEGICIVVSPLIALMKDQVDNLNKRGIPALAIYSGMSYSEIDIALDNAIYGDYKFLYVSPERLQTKLFAARVAKMRVSFLVVDEAHCISQWGYDFRPSYLHIKDIRRLCSVDGKQVPCIALTATATKVVAKDIMNQLNFREPNMIVSGFERPNLRYVVRKSENKMGQLLKICNGVEGSGIVYVSRRKSVEEIVMFLQSQGIEAGAYHAGMNRSVRDAVQREWMSGKVRVIVSTNAFGMGIDKGDVRFVAHYDMPASPEAYFQEAGRAGRDGKFSYAVLIWNDDDIARLVKITQSAYPSLDYIKDIYQKVFVYLGIAYEEGAGAGYKFDLEDFAKHQKLFATTAYYAIKYIEQSGYWTLTEELDIPSRVNMLINRDELYMMQLGSVELDNFIKVLMRLYTGLFSGYTQIDEEKIASSGKYSLLAVESKLKQLQAKGVLRYIPKMRSPILSLNNERLYEKNLRLPKSDYDIRVGRSMERVNAMIEYVHNDKISPSQFLINYFLL